MNSTVLKMSFNQKKKKASKYKQPILEIIIEAVFVTYNLYMLHQDKITIS